MTNSHAKHGLVESKEGLLLLVICFFSQHHAVVTGQADQAPPCESVAVHGSDRSQPAPLKREEAKMKRKDDDDEEAKKKRGGQRGGEGTKQGWGRQEVQETACGCVIFLSWDEEV